MGELMPKTKTTKSSTNPKRGSTKVCDIYTDLFTLRKTPISEAFIERLAADMVEWASKDEDALTLKQFPLSRGISWKTFERWTKKHDLLKSAYEDMKTFIAIRREKGMITRKYDTKATMHIQHRYDEDWKKADEFHSSLRKTEKADEKHGNITVVIPPIGKGEE